MPLEMSRPHRHDRWPVPRPCLVPFPRRAVVKGKRVAILVADGFEQVELTEPRKALDEAGAKTQIVSSASDQVQGWKHFDKADHFKVDVPLDSAKPENFDALLLPGGVANPDQLRTMPKQALPDRLTGMSGRGDSNPRSLGRSINCLLTKNVVTFLH
jgi:hypothetical protein